MVRLFLGMVVITILIGFLQESMADDRIKIGMIDSGISQKQSTSKILCTDGMKSMVEKDLGYDTHGHGTNIFGLISKDLDPKKYCIISYKIWNSSTPAQKVMQFSTNAIKQAVEDGVKFLNISMSGYGYHVPEFIALQYATQYMLVIVAAGNDSQSLDNRCDVFPACYRHLLKSNFYVIGGYDVKESNYGNIVDFYTYGKKMGIPVLSGTSQATAFFTNKLIKNNNKNVVY